MDPISKAKGLGHGSSGRVLPGMHDTLSLIPSTAKKKNGILGCFPDEVIRICTLKNCTGYLNSS
jgi:hypothetical protein